MTEQRTNGTETWEERINALLEGDLDVAEAEALKAEARNDQRLAAAIIDAYQLQQAMEHLRPEKAPASLRRKLRRIPSQQRPAYLQPRFAVAMAIVPLLVVAVVLMQPRQPSQAEIQQARQDLAVAFAYIDRVSDRTFSRMEREVGVELKNAVGGSVIKSIVKPKPSTQENSA